MTKLFCKGNHWYIKNNQVLLETPDSKDIEKARQMIKVIEANVRLKIYEQICAIDLTQNRKEIVKNGIENVALTVQDLIANMVISE